MKNALFNHALKSYLNQRKEYEDRPVPVTVVQDNQEIKNQILPPKDEGSMLDLSNASSIMSTFPVQNQSFEDQYKKDFDRLKSELINDKRFFFDGEKFINPTTKRPYAGHEKFTIDDYVTKLLKPSDKNVPSPAGYKVILQKVKNKNLGKDKPWKVADWSGF